MLGQTAALTDINQNPYQSYGGQRVAGFTPLQSQAMENIGNMQIAPQLGQATTMAGDAAKGGMGTAGTALNYGQQGVQAGQAGMGYGQQGVGLGVSGGAQYGQQGAGYGQQATGAGQRYQQMATDPSQMAAYMNPYLQQSLAPQLAMLGQQQALAGQDINAKAVGQGAFGGNRATLAQGLNAQNYDLARQKAIGEGYNTAFQQAQQAQQFGSTLGLQGLQTGIQGAQTGLQGVNTQLAGTAQGMQGAGLGIQGAQAGLQGVAGAQNAYNLGLQGANTLGQLGQSQYGQQMGINQAQQQAGALQQAQQQQGLDVNYQNFLKQQNYPYQQLAFQSDMLRGLPLSQTAQTMYAAPPSMASQIGGLGTAGLGIYGMSGGFRGGKAGGLMEAQSYKKGGQINYATGGDISMMSTEQLTKLLDNPTLTPMESSMIEEQLMLRARMQNNPQAAQIMGGGLDTAPSGDMFEAAGGGIVAFSGETDGSLVRTSERSSTPKPMRPEIKDYQGFLENQIRSSLENQDKVNPFAKSEAMQAQYAADMKERKEMRPYELLTALGIGTAAGNSQYGLSNLGQGGVYALQQQQKLAAEDAADRKLMLQQAVEQENAKYARDTGKLGSMQTALGQMYSKEIGLKNAGATSASTAAYRDQLLAQKYAVLWKDTLDDTKDTLLKQTKFNSIYRKDPTAFNRLAEQEAKRQMPKAALDILGKTPALADTGGGGSTIPALPSGFEIVKPK
jgi:hypothetical protein